MASVDPAERIWIFGEPHDMENNVYRVDMAKYFASPIMTPGDKWTSCCTFDYKKSIALLGSIYSKFRRHNRIVVMPHGSKMQTFGVNVFSSIHQMSLIFAMPKSYSPIRYSIGCSNVWSIRIKSTNKLIEKIRKVRVIGRE